MTLGKLKEIAETATPGGWSLKHTIFNPELVKAMIEEIELWRARNDYGSETISGNGNKINHYIKATAECGKARNRLDTLIEKL